MTRSFPVSYSVDSISSHCDYSSTTELSFEATIVTEESLLSNNGYIKHKVLTKTLQGELLTAQLIDHPDIVVLKKTSKRLYLRRETMDEDGFHYIIDEDILQEAATLRHLTLFNKPIGASIVQYIDFFESGTHFYLVMEYIKSNMNLKQFVIKCHQYIKKKQLKWKDYVQIMKYLLWQLVATIHWLHNDMKCCHLDLCPENIMVSNVQFVENRDNTVSINPKIGIKLVDFGASERFCGNIHKFMCNKQHISLDNEQYLAPNIYKQNYYDATAADMWSLGMIIYFCFIGDYPFKRIEAVIGSGYWFVYHNKLAAYLQSNGLLTSIPHKVLSLISGLLNVDEKKRFGCVHVLQHQWFHSYYRRYSSQIERKSNLQKKQLILQHKKHNM